MLNEKIYNDSYIKALKERYSKTNNIQKRAIINKLINLKVSLLKGEIEQDEYNDKLFDTLSKAPGFTEAIRDRNFWKGLYTYACQMESTRFGL